MIVKNHRHRSLLLFWLVTAAAISFTRGAVSQNVHQFNSGYTPQRVYDSKEKEFRDFESMVEQLTRAEVVFVGEQHDDPATHKLERAILEGLARRRGQIVVAMEMFERDVQPSLDDYLAGKLSEEEFLKLSRPWPRYATDYRPIVEFAKAHGWRVIASNTPRRLATQISRQGLAAVDAAPAADRNLMAGQIQCPIDDYFKRFNETMSSHPAADGKSEEKPEDKNRQEEQRVMIERFYYAQCVKDETMAESIAAQFQASTGSTTRPLVVHFNGAFHSDYRYGAAARTNRRMQKQNVRVVTIVPLENLDAIKPDEYRKRGDFIIFTLKPAKGK